MPTFRSISFEIVKLYVIQMMSCRIRLSFCSVVRSGCKWEGKQLNYVVNMLEESDLLVL